MEYDEVLHTSDLFPGGAKRKSPLDTQKRQRREKAAQQDGASKGKKEEDIITDKRLALTGRRE